MLLLSCSRRAGDCAPYFVAFFLLCAWQKSSAQLAPAEDFFNGGAQLYISNNIPAALERAEMGLKTYPDDEKLKKLEELLKQQQQQQNQQQQNQQNQQQHSQKDQQSKSDQQKNQQQNQQQNQKQDSQQQKQDQQQQSDQKKAEAQSKDAGDKSKDAKPDQPQDQPVQVGRMTPEEAKRVLDAQKGSEQLLQLKPDTKPRDRRLPLKDW